MGAHLAHRRVECLDQLRSNKNLMNSLLVGDSTPRFRPRLVECPGVPDLWSLTQQLTEHKGQDASVPVVVNLDGRINSQLDRLIDEGTALARDAQSDILTWRDIIGEPKRVEDFRAVQAQGLSGDAVRELQRKDAHPNKVRSVNALEALGDDGFHAAKACALGGPITAGARPVFLAGKDDQRDPVGLVGHASVVDECRLAVLDLDPLVTWVNFLIPQIEGISAFDTRNHQVLDADVRKGAAGHDAVVSTAGNVAVENNRGRAGL